MSNIDKQRVAAVTSMEASGYRWDGNMWVRPEGFNPVDCHQPLDNALRVLVMVHTQEDPQIGFTVQAPPVSYHYIPCTPDEYVAAWGVLRKHVGMPT